MLLFVVERLDNDDDKKFVTDLYEKYMPFFRARIYKRVNDTSICNDLAHDCMVNIIKHIDTVKNLPANKIGAYLSVCINNIIIDYYKKSSRENTCGIADLSEDYSLADDEDALTELERKCTYEIMRGAYEELCERDKSILYMKYELELNDEQIANTLNIKKDSSRMTVLRSTRKLKQQIKKKEEEST